MVLEGMPDLFKTADLRIGGRAKHVCDECVQKIVCKPVSINRICPIPGAVSIDLAPCTMLGCGIDRSYRTIKFKQGTMVFAANIDAMRTVQKCLQECRARTTVCDNENKAIWHDDGL